MTSKFYRTTMCHNLACLVGVSESIFLQNILELSDLNRMTDDYKYFVDNYWWLCASYKTLLDEMPFFNNTEKIKRMIKRLESSGYLISFTPRGIDKTKWYRVNVDMITKEFNAQKITYIDF